MSTKKRAFKELKIGPVVCDVNMSDRDAWNAYAATMGCLVYGAFDAWTGIHVDPSLPDSKKRVILVHELLHAIIDSMNVVLTAEMEEQLVTGMAVVLTEVLQDNPKLVEFITNGQNP